MYDTIEQLTKERVGNLLQRHGSIHAAAVRHSVEVLYPVLTLSQQVQSNVLSLLTRMRQVVLHPGLLPVDYLEQLGSSDQDEDDGPASIQVTPQEKVRLQGLLAQAIEDCEECPICFGTLNEPRITFCGHMFCLPW